ncbi:hypothetical protein [uncultured Tateyamaria sp.]|uniref:hypothetical protein n=1 Tax=uncultured Tateyamaria sp. TaxID=455651 RepID=UPI002629C61D|nr:hypothetical protein [uncultured Tateyamaria sp.]
MTQRTRFFWINVVAASVVSASMVQAGDHTRTGSNLHKNQTIIQLQRPKGLTSGFRAAKPSSHLSPNVRLAKPSSHLGPNFRTTPHGHVGQPGARH